MSETELWWLGFFTMATFTFATYSGIFIGRYLKKRSNVRKDYEQAYRERFGIKPDHLSFQDIKTVVDRYKK